MKCKRYLCNWSGATIATRSPVPIPKTQSTVMRRSAVPCSYTHCVTTSDTSVNSRSTLTATLSTNSPTPSHSPLARPSGPTASRNVRLHGTVSFPFPCWSHCTVVHSSHPATDSLSLIRLVRTAATGSIHARCISSHWINSCPVHPFTMDQFMPGASVHTGPIHARCIRSHWTNSCPVHPFTLDQFMPGASVHTGPIHAQIGRAHV